jgi:alpha-L-glutamate ligase-like protein
MKASHILGLNARTQLYSYRYNKRRGKSIAASKIKTEKVLVKEGIPTPKILKIFSNPEQILRFDWQSLPSSFALKPSRGLGGQGIIVIKKRSKDGQSWLTTDRKRINADDLKLHTLDILEGAYSMRNTPDTAFIQEYVGRHKAFRKFAYRGTPDIRIIVFNKVPVMAMMRLPTKDSGGRSNLHQGALGVGIDIATGITTKAIWYGNTILYKPGTKRKLNGIKIPQWTKILRLAVDTQIVTGLGYFGCDIMIHPEKGPMIVELNYQPGLQIQLANQAGLKKRLERVEDLHVIDAEHGVKIAKALFVASFADRVRADEGIRTISAVEQITIRGKDKQKKKVMAKIDTGAWRTSISEHLARELGLLDERNILWKTVTSAIGKQKRPVISLTFYIAGRKITTPASVAKRMTLKYPVLIGRKNLKGLLVDPKVEIEVAKKAREQSQKKKK